MRCPRVGICGGIDESLYYVVTSSSAWARTLFLKRPISKIRPGPIFGAQVEPSEVARTPPKSMSRTPPKSMSTGVHKRRVSVGIEQTYFGECFGALARASAGMGRVERKA